MYILYIFSSDNLQKILEGDFESRRLYVYCVNFLSVLCSEEGKLQSRNNADDNMTTITKLLNVPLQPGLCEFHAV